MCAALAKAYGSPRHGNPLDPFDDLLFILLSNRTAPAVAARVYRELKARFPTGDDLLHANRDSLLAVLEPAGLANKRVEQLLAIAERVHKDFGAVSLDGLASWSDEGAEAYLVTLPGVSAKVARCVLMYAFERRVLPVDVHVHRVATRLGWITNRRADQSHEALDDLVAPELRFGFHVNALAHGRALCVASLPLCGECVVRDHCHYSLTGGPARSRS